VLLRASSEALGETAKLEGTVGRGDGGVAHGTLLAEFAEVATRASEDLPASRRNLLDAVGAAAFVEAAATVGIFNGLVRIADAIGIPLDEGTLRASSGFREDLGLNDFWGARSTDLVGGDDQPTRDVRKLFDAD
jgi:hypothetical protein